MWKVKYLLVVGCVLFLAACGPESNSSSDSQGSESDRTAEGESGTGEGSAGPSDTQAEPAQRGFADLEDALRHLGMLPIDPVDAEDFSLTDIDGETVRLSDYRGDVVFLNFWATWCGPCKEEMPLMQSVYQDLQDEGFTIIAVNFQETLDMARDYIREYGYTYPVPVDKTGEVSGRYSVRGLPTSYIINRQGRVIAAKAGQLVEDEQSEDAFRAIVEAL